MLLDLESDTHDAVFREALLAWYDHEHRQLPWRSDPRPYRVWVSEIMLQQTQVVTVIDYFERWMERFPTVRALAEAPLDDVLQVWAGLGYYRRARLIHKCAQAIVEEHDGEVPGSHKALLALPGIGPYTAGAIASIAFGIPAPIVDGNVIRILARLCAIKGDARGKEAQKHFWRIAERLVPHDRAGDFNQAMMELGATLCTPKRPKCLLCPVRSSCKGNTLGIAEQLPEMPARKKQKRVHVVAPVLCRGEATWMVQRPQTGLWAGLWSMPEVVLDGAPRGKEPGKKHLVAWLDTHTIEGERDYVGKAEHLLTHRHYVVHVWRIRVDRDPPIDGRWVSGKDRDDLAMSALMDKLFRLLES